MKADNFLIAGSDKKMIECKNRLKNLGYEAVCFEGEAFWENFDCYNNIILPLPSISNGTVAGTGGKSLNYLKSLLRAEQRVFYSNIENITSNDFGYSYYYDESFLVKNSRLTAQGVLKIILENTEKDMFLLKAAVIGYGRCGKAICKMLNNNGFDVTSFSRNSKSKAFAENDGCNIKDISQIDLLISSFDIIINTVPHNIISEKGIETLSTDNLYIEVASKPYGFDISKSDIFNFKYVLGSSLPGKYTPVSAGVNIADTVIEILKEGKYG